MRDILKRTGFQNVTVTELPLVFTAPQGRFAEHFRSFAARAAVILDAQSNDVLDDIYASWDARLGDYLLDGRYEVPMPALAVSAVREA